MKIMCIHSTNVLLRACCVLGPVPGPGGQGCQLQRYLAQSSPQGAYRSINAFVNNPERGEQQKAKKSPRTPAKIKCAKTVLMCFIRLLE